MHGRRKLVVMSRMLCLQLQLAALGMLFPMGFATAALWTVTDQNGKPLEHAVVTLRTQVESAAELSLISSDASTAAFTAEVNQIEQEFSPFVSVVPKGTEVAFPNQDLVLHHVYSFSPAKTFQLKLYKGRAHSPVLFDEAGIVELGCNIHDRMRGYIVVTDAEIFGVTDASGHLELDVEQGVFDAQVWHPRQLATQPSTEVSFVSENQQPTALMVSVAPPLKKVRRGLKAWAAKSD